MTAVPFNTLKLANGLEAGGVMPATKTNPASLEQRVTARLGGMLVAAAGIVLAIRYLPAR